MRLWHKNLISKLPRQQLLGQHRECCALRGKGWGRSHSVINYVFDHSYMCLYNYHIKVMNEMKIRGYNVTEAWLDYKYRGKKIYNTPDNFFEGSIYDYPEHNDEYLNECLDNLRNKGIIINK